MSSFVRRTAIVASGQASIKWAAAWGMLGASLGTAMATAIGWWCAMHHMSRVLRVGIRHAFAWVTWLVCVVLASSSAALALIAASVASATTGSVAARVVVKVVVFTTVFVVGLRCWRASRYSAGPPARFVPEPAITLVGSA